MYNGPPDMMNVPTGTPFVTKLKTKILFRMDYVLQCQTDEQALNGWRLLCADGIALVRLALEDGLLEKLKNPVTWNELAQKILMAWPPKTFEKTQLVRESEGYRGEYDHYCVEVRTADLQIGMESLKQEKFNVINTKLMEIWGDCYSIAMAVGYLNLEEEIEIPVSREYTSKSLGAETDARRQPRRPANEAKSLN